MEIIIANTISNALSKHETQNSRIRKTHKKVNFEVEKNDYYEPKKLKEEEPVFYDLINSTSNEHPMHLNDISSF